MSSAIPLQPTLAEERIANEMLDLIPIANEKKKQTEGTAGDFGLNIYHVQCSSTSSGRISEK